ncbi:hypothetical protein HCG51_19125 [Tolypothrix sp. PCC 7910]|uniref:hypothetical protein n=1 Tax=Tolypothrix sp. PCC 7910 TaxID=2099387 RepID=UPI001427808F|nr:hypothetical protein [Tolypothrix sp. PCC 7910]QIR38601.1 hypothetical protein HCG51_19125 [Tolypothrix sp. PCC 7910]
MRQQVTVLSASLPLSPGFFGKEFLAIAIFRDFQIKKSSSLWQAEEKSNYQCPMLNAQCPIAKY